MRRLLIAFTSFVLLTVPALAGQAPAGQSGFVPVDSLPPSEQLPAAPLLIGAYAFVWLAVIVYLFTIWRRLNKVEADMRSLANKIQR